MKSPVCNIYTFLLSKFNNQKILFFIKLKFYFFSIEMLYNWIGNPVWDFACFILSLTFFSPMWSLIILLFYSNYKSYKLTTAHSKIENFKSFKVVKCKQIFIAINATQPYVISNLARFTKFKYYCLQRTNPTIVNNWLMVINYQLKPIIIKTRHIFMNSSF